MKKHENNVSTSDEDDEASHNDVIDISKTDYNINKANNNEDASPINQQKADSPKKQFDNNVYQIDNNNKYQFSLQAEKQQQFIVPNLHQHLMPRNDLAIYSSPRLDSTRRQQQLQERQNNQVYDHPSASLDNQIYGDNQKLTTFQQPVQQRLLTLSPTYITEKLIIQNLDGKNSFKMYNTNP